MGQRSDRLLLNDIRAGQRDACVDLMRSNYAQVYRFLLHLTRDVHTAEDLTQETFTTAWEKIGFFRGNATLNTWLHKIAYNKFIDGQRALNRSAVMAARVQGQQVESQHYTPLDEVIKDEQARYLYIAVQSLVESDRVAIVLHYLQGMSFREMAGVLNEPMGTIKWRISEALNRLRLLLMTGIHHEDKQRSTRI